MNCKPGDLAVIVRPDKIENLGKLVTVIRFVGSYKYFDGSVDSDAWCVRAEQDVTYRAAGVSYPAGSLIHCSDYQLRPIRPQADDATDESAAWLPPVPTRETVPA